MNSFPIEALTYVSEVPTFWVVIGPCNRCNRPFAAGELALAVGPPQYSLVHYKCAPIHDFTSYRHQKPLIEYYKNTTELQKLIKEN